MVMLQAVMLQACFILYELYGTIKLLLSSAIFFKNIIVGIIVYTVLALFFDV